MSPQNIAAEWAVQLGLADAPLFSAAQDKMDEEAHRVLLDGGAGSFALSELEGGAFEPVEFASWAWSSDLSHHVGVTGDDVHVVRWDALHPRKFSRSSVERQLEKFYRYLVLDNAQSSGGIVTHAIELFRRIRSATLEAGVSDEASIHVFLLFLNALLKAPGEAALEDVDALAADAGLDPQFGDAYRRIAEKDFPPLIEHFVRPQGSSDTFRLWPSLMVRHAGGIVFQEAHYDLEQWQPADLLGLPGIADVKVTGRGGIHFTPPGLARVLVERALCAAGDKPDLSIFDPACGSGIFLHEALRTLRRREYNGRIRLIGYDLSPSAIAMANFTVKQALQDWPEACDRIDAVDIQQCDALAHDKEWPTADVVIMNPPFVSWGALSETARDNLRELLGNAYAGRADLSMAFIQRAVNSLKAGGVVGTLLPASLFTLASGRVWRQQLLERASIDFLGVLGDHTLFHHAMVEVGTLVAVKLPDGGEGEKKDFTSVWTDETRGAASEALRAVRQSRDSVATSKSNDHWRVARQNVTELQEAATWRPRPNRLDKVLQLIARNVPTSVGDVFDVRQGAIPGKREAFVISEALYKRLPSREKPFFRPVAENRNIRNGRILPDGYVFYPNSDGIPEIRNEEDLQKAVPSFLKLHFRNFKDALTRRARIGEDEWWRLSEARNWIAEKRHRVVTAYFGRSGSFALDESGEHVVVQGYGWIPGDRLEQHLRELGQSSQDRVGTDIYLAYLALLNSRAFDLLLAEFCPHMAGGQFNLSKRYISLVPLPNLAEMLITAPSVVYAIQALAKLGKAIKEGQLTDDQRLDAAVAAAYGLELSDWPSRLD